MKRDIIIAITALVGLIGIGMWAQMNYVKQNYTEQSRVVNYIDSVWSTKPGQEHSLQTSYKYYGRLDNGRVVSHHKPFNIGDSIVSIYYGK